MTRWAQTTSCDPCKTKQYVNHTPGVARGLTICPSAWNMILQLDNCLLCSGLSENVIIKLSLLRFPYLRNTCFSYPGILLSLNLRKVFLYPMSTSCYFTCLLLRHQPHSVKQQLRGRPRLPLSWSLLCSCHMTGAQCILS